MGSADDDDDDGLFSRAEWLTVKTWKATEEINISALASAYYNDWSEGSRMKPTRDSTQKAERSWMGWSNERPAAMYVERRIRWEEGEYEAPVTPERLVFRQKVVGRTTHTFVYQHTARTEKSRNSRSGGAGRSSSPPLEVPIVFKVCAVCLRLGTWGPTSGGLSI